MHQKVAGLIPGQGIYLDCGFDPWLWRVQEAADQCFPLTLMFLCVSPPFPLPLSLKSIKHPQMRLKKYRHCRGISHGRTERL